MKNRLNFFVYAMFISVVGFCQEKVSYNHFPDLSDSKEYFRLLFGTNGSINLPYTIIKIGVKDQPFFLITSKADFKNYFKRKFSVTDRVAEAKELFFLRKNDKIFF
ncbi:MAG: hypothetical protein ACRDE5_03160, partial [Ginsengibacter sp.]